MMQNSGLRSFFPLLWKTTIVITCHFIIFWRLKTPARRCSLLFFSPGVSKASVSGPGVLVLPCRSHVDGLMFLFLPGGSHLVWKKTHTHSWKVVSLLWVVETVQYDYNKSQDYENVTSGPSAWNWTGLLPQSTLFSSASWKILSFHQRIWPLPDVIFYPSHAVHHHILTTHSHLRHFVSPSPPPPRPPLSMLVQTAVALLTAQPPPVASMIWTIMIWEGPISCSSTCVLAPWLLAHHPQVLSYPPMPKSPSSLGFAHLSHMKYSKARSSHLPKCQFRCLLLKYSPGLPVKALFFCPDLPLSPLLAPLRRLM